jgi:hypothetical protein
MLNRSTANSIDQYIAEFPPATQQVLQAVRAISQAAAPAATETISYAIPTFDLNGKHLVLRRLREAHRVLSNVERDRGVQGSTEALQDRAGLGAVPGGPAITGRPDPPDRRIPGRTGHRPGLALAMALQPAWNVAAPATNADRVACLVRAVQSILRVWPSRYGSRSSIPALLRFVSPPSRAILQCKHRKSPCFHHGLRTPIR